MSKYASKVVGQAQAWIGKKESNGSHKEIIDVYNFTKILSTLVLNIASLKFFIIISSLNIVQRMSFCSLHNR